MNYWMLKMADQAQAADDPGHTYLLDNTHSVQYELAYPSQYD